MDSIMKLTEWIRAKWRDRSAQHMIQGIFYPEHVNLQGCSTYIVNRLSVKPDVQIQWIISLICCGLGSFHNLHIQ